MIYIALDIDGVLHSVDARNDADDPELKPFSHLPHFEAVVRDYSDVRVVISSDWQKHYTLEELRTFFSEDLRERIVGVTGRHLGDTEPGNRQRDVERYLAECRIASLRMLPSGDVASPEMLLCYSVSPCAVSRHQSKSANEKRNEPQCTLGLTNAVRHSSDSKPRRDGGSPN